jgi:hypothetical protein
MQEMPPSKGDDPRKSRLFASFRLAACPTMRDGRLFYRSVTITSTELGQMFFLPLGNTNGPAAGPVLLYRGISYILYRGISYILHFLSGNPPSPQ